MSRPHFTLRRLFEIPDYATIGILMGDRLTHRAIATLELPWRDNQRDVSCVPEGFYALERHDGREFKDTWALVGGRVRHDATFDETLRYGIVLHIGNFPSDTLGCILPGRELKFAEDGVPWVSESQQALDDFRAVMAGEEAYLTIERSFL